jgi:DNA-binding CsgD family transcriptional regulator
VVSDGLAHCPSPIASPVSLDMFALGLDSLSPQAYRLLGSAAVLAEPFTLEQVAVAAGNPIAVCTTGVHEAIAAGVLTEDDGEISFVQDVTHRHFRDALPASMRRSPLSMALPSTALNRRNLPSIGPQPSALEPTWAVSGAELRESVTQGERVAFDIVGRAVRDLEERSPAAAARLLVHASKVLSTRSPHFSAVVARAVPLVAAAGDFNELETLVNLTSSAPFSADQRTEITIGVVEGLSHQGRYAEVVTHTVAALAREQLSSRQRASLLAFQAHARLSTSETPDLAGVEALVTQALAESRISRHAPAEVLSLVVSSLVHHARGELPRAVDAAAAAVRRAEISPGALRMHPGVAYARALLAVDRAGEAEQILVDGQWAAAALGMTWSQSLWHEGRAELLLAQGRIPDALTECEKGLARVGSASSALPALHLIRAWCLIGLGQLDQADQSVTEAEPHCRSERSFAQLDWTRVWLTNLVDDRFRLSQLLRRALRRQLAPATSLILAIPVIRTLLTNGNRSVATQLCEHLFTLARVNPGIWSRQALACHAEGLLLGVAAALDNAANHYRAAGLLGAVPWVLSDLAVLQAAAGEADAAITSVQTARLMFTEHGNLLGATMADEALSGLRASRTGAVTDESALDALSPSERRVVELVVAGHTNRQVASLLTLSPHTVDSHLRHIFIKVGVANRVQLSAAFHAAAATKSWSTPSLRGAHSSQISADRPAAAVAGLRY